MYTGVQAQAGALGTTGHWTQLKCPPAGDSSNTGCYLVHWEVPTATRNQVNTSFLLPFVLFTKVLFALRACKALSLTIFCGFLWKNNHRGSPLRSRSVVAGTLPFFFWVPFSPVRFDWNFWTVSVAQEGCLTLLQFQGSLLFPPGSGPHA